MAHTNAMLLPPETGKSLLTAAVLLGRIHSPRWSWLARIAVVDHYQHPDENWQRNTGKQQ